MCQANVILDGTKTLDDVACYVQEPVHGVFEIVGFVEYRVSYAKIGSLLLNIEGVQDYDDLRLNNSTGNIIVGEKEIPAMGTVSLEEVHTIAAD